MPAIDTLLFQDSLTNSISHNQPLILNNNGCKIPFCGGLFIDNSVSSSLVNTIVSRTSSHYSTELRCSRPFGLPQKVKGESLVKGGSFMCMSLVVKNKNGVNCDSNDCVMQNGSKGIEKAVVGTSEKGVATKKEGGRMGARRHRALNTTKHLWAGAVAAMVSRTFLAPLERLKLEYVVRGEQKHLFELIQTIAATQGLRGFWKGNLVNILRTAPFKAVNFCAFDTYRKQIRRLTGNEETTNTERFIAGAAAGMTATVLCLPLDTVRTNLVAKGGEALGGVVGAFCHVIQTEGFFALYKGLVPSILSMAPSGAVFYGVYDILKSAYLRSPQGRKKVEYMKQHGEELSALDQLELGTMRTLLYGAVSGACAEAATYPFEVVRRQLQLQGRKTKLNTFSTFLKIVEQGGVPGLYAGLIPSLLQVLPSAAISYCTYEVMKVVLKVE
ncbi:hypothetical protein Leryth_006350 [Lithospermum erythrorhizon]|nr:hypothetical protein Leryth_006350 [Lithospermum erythrorhizon]